MSTPDNPDFDFDDVHGCLPKSVGARGGFLNDREIEAALKAGYLLYPRTARKAGVRYASYELRISDAVEFLRTPNATTGEQERYERIALKNNGEFHYCPVKVFLTPISAR